MGVLTIEAGGSFTRRRASFEAIEHGHAHAVAQAIQYLAEVVLPEAIEQDHRLHEEGERPRQGFDRP